MRRTARALLGTTAVSLVAIAVGPVGTAIAAPPIVTITSPLNGSVSNNPTPLFRGRVEVASGEVTLIIYKGPTTKGAFVQELSPTRLVSDGTWSLGPAEFLSDGTYTAQAFQS